jgi:ligand-binding SRPBCC domain-containing protein
VQQIQLETKIAAPPMRCFLLSLSIDLHVDSTASTQERAVAGVVTGLIGEGESVTWRGRHFGFLLNHTSKITRYEPPAFFQDVMTAGMFKSFEHDHRFHEQDRETIMRDELRFSAPLGILGLTAERFVLRSYLTRFLRDRNTIVKKAAESGRWREYLSKAHMPL